MPDLDDPQRKRKLADFNRWKAKKRKEVPIKQCVLFSTSALQSFACVFIYVNLALTYACRTIDFYLQRAEIRRGKEQKEFVLKAFENRIFNRQFGSLENTLLTTPLESATNKNPAFMVGAAVAKFKKIGKNNHRAYVYYVIHCH